MARRNPAKTVEVITHGEAKRRNIPTAEQMEAGVEPREIGIFVRVEAQLDRAGQRRKDLAGVARDAPTGARESGRISS